RAGGVRVRRGGCGRARPGRAAPHAHARAPLARVRRRRAGRNPGRGHAGQTECRRPAPRVARPTAARPAGVPAGPPARAARARRARRADGQPRQARLLGRRQAGAGGAAPGTVRLDGHPPRGGRASAGRAAPARPQLPPRADHRRPPQLLVDHVLPGPQGPPRPLPQAQLARGPPHRQARSPRRPPTAGSV
ncbi:MAG: ATP-dependent helicase HrpB, partial [uncultured Phycisphaerae bacterium]